MIRLKTLLEQTLFGINNAARINLAKGAGNFSGKTPKSEFDGGVVDISQDRQQKTTSKDWVRETFKKAYELHVKANSSSYAIAKQLHVDIEGISSGNLIKTLHAIKDIEQQCKDFGIDAIVINYESVTKVDSSNLDILILDEAHSIGAYPKPTNRFKDIKSILTKENRYTRIIYLSGTPSPESYSQLFHQFRVSDEFSPFKDYTNFYKWAKDYVKVTQKQLGYGLINDYSKCDIFAVNVL